MIETTNIFEFFKKGKFYQYNGPSSYYFLKGKIYRCFNSTYTGIQLKKENNQVVSVALGPFDKFPFDWNKIENWEPIKAKVWADVI